MPILIKTIEEYNELINKKNLTLIHFSAKWAEQCSQINDVLDELSKQEKYIESKITFVECEAEDLTEISLKHNIDAVPTILYFCKGKLIDRVDGTDIGQINDKIQKHNFDQNTLANIELEERLVQLINQHSVMIFMKGDRNRPQCGFSKCLIEIMNDTGVEYETFDILQDEEVRQNLKKFSQWPTYPQLYVKGQLIGGLDIVKQIKEAGELESTLKGE